MLDDIKKLITQIKERNSLFSEGYYFDIEEDRRGPDDCLNNSFYVRILSDDEGKQFRYEDKGSCYVKSVDLRLVAVLKCGIDKFKVLNVLENQLIKCGTITLVSSGTVSDKIYREETNAEGNEDLLTSELQLICIDFELTTVGFGGCEQCLTAEEEYCTTNITEKV